ncbi:prolyl oligopeptidase family serine peptidase [Niabella sp. CC-SYL272]|uniref:S9 family peptidase n=1 Tax=Niabella agricola TaxID=2891571 RepID=UPI001F2A18FD|nr:prolyl oligopeptidase family serine peptidase [Niabella agricola]MCF3111211.1 prolyl oligopeptidase family serine peptidase [Niabella agricola]
MKSLLTKTTAVAAMMAAVTVSAQNNPGVLTVEEIMRDPKWMGSSPADIAWANDGHTLLFNWNPDRNPADSLYRVTMADKTPHKLAPEEQLRAVYAYQLRYNGKRTAAVWAKEGDVYYRASGGRVTRVTQTLEGEYNPVFSFNDTRIVYTRGQNLYSWDIATGASQQLTNFTSDAPADKNKKGNAEEEWLKQDQLATMDVLRERSNKRLATARYQKAVERVELRPVYLGGNMLTGVAISPDGRFVTYQLYTAGNGKRTVVPDYVTESGYTTDISGRTKVGSPQGSARFFVYDRIKDTAYKINTELIPGIRDIPAFVKDYPAQWEKLKKDPPLRNVNIWGVVWSPNGKYALLDVYADDNKDRWLMLMDTATRNLKLVNRQHDDAWVGGPGIDPRSIGWINSETAWFQSESTGYSHLYLYSLASGTERALTKGNYEVQDAKLSNDKQSFYITTNEVHPGEKQFYKLNIKTGTAQRLTTLEGANEVNLSPDEKYLAIRNSYINRPWELFLQENKAGAKLVQITHMAQSKAYLQYHWRIPEVISFAARDGAPVYARVYKPENPKPGMPAVLFVHGAGYLQNAHKWWSSYFREYMFNNLLADNGYYVMDIDYRGSAGYGRNWRTGIYRHMGGRDLTDHVDAVKYLTDTYKIDPAKVGIYGGSYGGFMTLMALFTMPDVFTSGAALRPVTDWANYNHGYTSNILNEPFTDSIAYHKSSPVYFAKGLKGNLLICHGMVDVNVHYQDAVKLAQRLMELKKDNWELASYPMEDHGFVEPASWTDEYKRIFKIFEQTLKK